MVGGSGFGDFARAEERRNTEVAHDDGPQDGDRDAEKRAAVGRVEVADAAHDGGHHPGGSLQLIDKLKA